MAVILGGLGNDTLYGTKGKDWIEGGAGNDWLYGGSGNDKLYGGNGDDVLVGGDGADIAHGGAGADFFDAIAGTGRDTLYGDAGNDVFYIDDDTAFGGLGKDTFNVDLSGKAAGTAVVSTGAGSDTISVYADRGADHLVVKDLQANDKLTVSVSDPRTGDVLHTPEEIFDRLDRNNDHMLTKADSSTTGDFHLQVDSAGMHLTIESTHIDLEHVQALTAAQWLL